MPFTPVMTATRLLEVGCEHAKTATGREMTSYVSPHALVSQHVTKKDSIWQSTDNVKTW